MERPKISAEELNQTIYALQTQLGWRLNEKGSGSFSSSHEILGCVAEEYFELVEAVKSSSTEAILSELYDLAVAAVFGAACLERGKVDW